MKKPWQQLIFSLSVPLAVGGLSAWLSREGMQQFNTLRQPSLSPPMWLFPVVWILLFLMMGLAAWQVWQQPLRPRSAMTAYGIQLGFNFVWPLLFFRWGLFFPALIWLVVLWGLILWTLLLFRSVRTSAGWLLLPYLLWVSFAAYLNAGIWILN